MWFELKDCVLEFVEQEKDDEEESSGGGGAEPEVSATPAVVVFSSSHMFTGEEKETREGYFGRLKCKKGENLVKWRIWQNNGLASVGSGILTMPFRGMALWRNPLLGVAECLISPREEIRFERRWGDIFLCCSGEYLYNAVHVTTSMILN